jgi:methyl-galactoside transport system permease protein
MKLKCIEKLKSMDTREKKAYWSELLINNSLYIFLIAAITLIAILNPRFLSWSSIINIISLSAANLPIALGIAGAIILTGTDLSAGRIVGLVACVSAALLQSSDYVGKMFPALSTMPIIVVFLIILAIGALVGLINGFCTATFHLHPFIVTLSTQLIVYGALLMFLMIGNNNGQSLSGLDPAYTSFIKGSIFSIGGTPIPNYVWYVLVITAIMWVVWNKTSFGKNMFAVGSNPDAANVSGVNVKRVIMLVFMLAGIMYGITGFIEAARIGSNSAAT